MHALSPSVPPKRPKRRFRLELVPGRRVNLIQQPGDLFRRDRSERQRQLDPAPTGARLPDCGQVATTDDVGG